MTTEQKYSRSKTIVIGIKYKNQLGHSRVRGHDAPAYSLSELRVWLDKNTDYDKIYDKWVESGYDKNLKPSIDRKNDSKGYTFSNITMTTWYQNNMKKNTQQMHGELKASVKCKPVIQLTKAGDKIATYFSIHEASRSTGIGHCSIRNCIGGRSKSAGGFKWKIA